MDEARQRVHFVARGREPGRNPYYWAPDRAHGLNEPYFIRRRWDYFVRHLPGAEPPGQYEIVRPTG